MEGWRKRYGLTCLLPENEMCNYRGMTSKELVSHTIKIKERGCLLYSILNYYLYTIYGSSFWGHGIAHQAFISESKSSYTMKLSLNCEIYWIQWLEKEQCHIYPELLANPRFNHISGIIKQLNQALDVPTKLKKNRNDNKRCESEPVNKKG